MKAVKGRIGRALFLSLTIVIQYIDTNTPFFAYYTKGPHKVTAVPARLSYLKLASWYLFEMPSRRWRTERGRRQSPRTRVDQRTWPMDWQPRRNGMRLQRRRPLMCRGNRAVPCCTTIGGGGRWCRRSRPGRTARWCRWGWSRACQRRSTIGGGTVLPGRSPGPCQRVVLQEK